MFTKWIIIISILLLGTQIIRLPIGNLSLFQISIFFVGLTSFISFFKLREIKQGYYFFFSILFFISGVVGYFFSLSPEASSNLLLSTMSAMLLWIVPVSFDRCDSTLLFKTLIRSQYLAIPLGVFVFYINHTFGIIPAEINLPGGLAIICDENFLQRSTMNSNLDVRLSLPYPTPPVLSIAMAMSIVMLYYSKNAFSSTFKKILIICFTLLLIGTGSRSGVFGLLCFILLRVYSNRKSIRFNWGVISFLFISVILLIWAASEFDYFANILSRFTSKEEDLSEDRHLLIPIDGIIIWLSSVKNIVFGIGLGSSFFIDGQHTYLPPTFLNSFVTLIAERGLMGLVLVLIWIRTGTKLYKRRYLLDYEEKAIVFGLITGMFSTLFYEVLTCYYYIFIMAVSFMLESRLRSRKRTCSYETTPI